jgi:hypothetical protein
VFLIGWRKVERRSRRSEEVGGDVCDIYSVGGHTLDLVGARYWVRVWVWVWVWTRASRRPPHLSGFDRERVCDCGRAVIIMQSVTIYESHWAIRKQSDKCRAMTAKYDLCRPDGGLRFILRPGKSPKRVEEIEIQGQPRSEFSSSEIVDQSSGRVNAGERSVSVVDMYAVCSELDMRTQARQGPTRTSRADWQSQEADRTEVYLVLSEDRVVR